MRPKITRVLRNGRATIVFFSDGTKTVAKRPIDEPDDPLYGVCVAIAKRMVGSGAKLKKLVESIEWADEKHEEPTSEALSQKIVDGFRDWINELENLGVKLW